jgi:hypothetical protein
MKIVDILFHLLKEPFRVDDPDKLERKKKKTIERIKLIGREL